MKSCLRGFMRWRSREGPWGSHQLEAKALKWETSVEETDELEDEDEDELEDELEEAVCAECRRIWGLLRRRAARVGGERRTRRAREEREEDRGVAIGRR